jgi:hypothetical protein
MVGPPCLTLLVAPGGTCPPALFRGRSFSTPQIEGHVGFPYVGQSKPMGTH